MDLHTAPNYSTLKNLFYYKINILSLINNNLQPHYIFEIILLIVHNLILLTIITYYFLPAYLANYINLQSIIYLKHPQNLIYVLYIPVAILLIILQTYAFENLLMKRYIKCMDALKNLCQKDHISILAINNFMIITN